MIVKKPLEELIALELEQKEFLVRPKDKDSIERPLSYELLARGMQKSAWYVASRIVHSFPKRETVELTKDGIPICKAQVGPIEVAYYDSIFLRNSGMASAMGGLHQQSVLELYGQMKEEKHPILKTFKQDMAAAIKKAPRIHEAMQKKHYFDDDDDWNAIPKQEKWLFGCLTATKSSFKRLEKDAPENYDPHKINLKGKQHGDCSSGDTKEEACFLIWYRGYLRSAGYEQRVKESQGVFYTAMQEWLDRETKALEEHGFKQIKIFR